jgi:hypothetical protein
VKWPALKVRAAALAGYLPAGFVRQIEASEEFDRILAAYPEVDKEKAWAKVVEIHRTTVAKYTEAVAQVIEAITKGATWR